MSNRFPLAPLVVAVALSLTSLASHARYDADSTAAAGSAKAIQDDSTDRLIVRYRQSAAADQALRSRM